MFMKADHLATSGRLGVNAIVPATRGRIFMDYQDLGTAIALILNVIDTQQVTLDIASIALSLIVRAYAEDLSVQSDQSVDLSSESYSLDLEIE